MLRQQNVSFQSRNPEPMPPRIKSARNLLFGKPKLDQFSCRQSTDRFQTNLEGRKRLRAEIHIDMDDQYRQFMLTKNPNTNFLQ